MGSFTVNLLAVNKLVMRAGPTLSHQQRIELCATVTELEIINSLKAIGEDKAPGIDSYNVVFLKKAWHIIKEDVIGVVQYFFITWKIYRNINCTAVTLVPKVSSPMNIKEYIPIACCTAGFILGRRIGDNIILAHEIVKSYTRKHVSPRCMIKLDLKNTYGSVEWIYLEQLLHTCKWVTNRTISSSKGFKTRRPNVTIPFRDRYDGMFSTILWGPSGLQVNMGKSCIYFGWVTSQEKEQILYSTGFTCGDLPFKYLGVPLSTKKISLIQWYPLITKMIARISSWTSKKLSYAGRTQLVQSMLFGIQAYLSQLFVLSAKVAWNKVCSPLCFGGLNLTNVSVWNRAAIAKTHWALAKKEDKLWIRWVDESSRRSLTRQLYNPKPRVIWRNLMYKNVTRPRARFTLRNLENSAAVDPSQDNSILVIGPTSYRSDKKSENFGKKSRKSNAIAKEIAFVCSVRAPPRINALMSTFRFSCD
ncbi:hypothetical protein H5410_035969 [Solanum commersonii]|uniref:Reverse transcriptase domain-containing protein n=1 Tax=Solanum commersonii TaxID=4109 RepID=A0A9J5Y2T0_SOLCO|nr:hypothetical protein H5410_035969 [Solanum commersonii]